LGCLPHGGERGSLSQFPRQLRKLEGISTESKNLFIYQYSGLKSIITKQKRNAMQQCHARFYYYCREGYHQEVPESYPEHPFDRGFHFSSLDVLIP
jgi:hypothetical protein